MAKDIKPAPVLTEAEKLALRRRRRSVALALVLGGLVVIFYVLTIVKMGPGVLNREL